jgi:hypothetical protein
MPVRADSTPIINILGDEYAGWWAHEYLATFAKVPRQALIELHKDRLGRQSHTATGEYRYYVWDRLAEDGWRVYVSQFKGVGFEVLPAATPDQARAAWQNYKRRLDG